LSGGLPLGLDEKLVSNFAKGCAESWNELSHFAGKRKSGEYDVFVNLLMAQSDALLNLYALAILQEIGLPDQILKAKSSPRPRSGADYEKFFGSRSPSKLTHSAASVCDGRVPERAAPPRPAGPEAA